MLKIIALTLGPAMTNAYLIADSDRKEAVVIDPAWDGKAILKVAEEHDWCITNIWVTHAHFDHIGGAAEVADGLNPPPPIALHKDDYWLWRAQGGAPLFGMQIDPGPEPTVELSDKQKLYLGDYMFEVRFAPGHTPGHVMFYCEAEKVMFTGDVIFQGSIGRTDLPGGGYQTLLDSIREQVLTLPDDTRLLSGHGPETTVGFERLHNPFL